MDNLKKAFGSNLKILRKSHKLTQEKLAELININHRQLARIEAGQSFLTAETIEKISMNLNVSIRELFDFDLRNELSCTGTDDFPAFSAKIKNNTIYLKSSNEFSESLSIDNNMKAPEQDDNFISIAKKIKKSVKIDFFEDKRFIHTKIYHSDGNIETILPNTQNFSMNMDSLLCSIKKIATSDNKTAFVKLAIAALDDKMALEKLKYLIQGLELKN